MKFCLGMKIKFNPQLKADIIKIFMAHCPVWYSKHYRNIFNKTYIIKKYDSVYFLEGVPIGFYEKEIVPENDNPHFIDLKYIV